MSRFSGLELKSVSINTFMQFVSRLIGSTATLFTTLLITYFLGLDAVGSFTKVIAFVSIFYLFSDFGFNSIFLKNYFGKVDQQIGNLVTLRLVISIILLPIVGLLAFFLPYNAVSSSGFSEVEKVAIIIYSLTLVGVSLNNTLQAYLQKKLSYSLSVLPSFVSNVILIAIVLFAVYSSSLYFLFSAYIFSSCICSLLTFFSLRNKYKIKLETHAFRSFSKKMFYSSWPLALMLIFNFLYVRADIFILSFLKPSIDVGTYGISYRFFEIALALPAFLANSTYPLLLKTVRDKKKYLTIFEKYLKLYAVLSIMLMIGILTLSPVIYLLGNSFSQSVLPLQILTLSLPFFFLTSILQWHFLIKGRLMFLIPLYCCVLILNIMLNLFLIPKFSYYAAAAITGISEALVFVVMLWYFKKSKLD